MCILLKSYTLYKGGVLLNTKLISTDKIVPGMIVAEDVFGLQDYLIIPAHSELTNHSITRLRFYGIKEILIELDESGEPERRNEGEIISDSYSEYIKKTTEFKKFSASFTSVEEDFKNRIRISNKQLQEPIQTDALLNDVEQILHESRNGTHVLHMLHCMRNNDDATYAHSVSVALLCNVFGHWLKYSEEDIQTLTLAGLLHDLGKLLVPSRIISKPSVLSAVEYVIIKHHPTDGYQLLEPQDLDSRIKNAALMHHERKDGSGYPQGLKGDEIDEFAQIVGIADVYEAMTSPRVYRRPNCPFDAISVFEQDGLQMFNPGILLTILEGLANTYINCSIKLTDDRVGEIVMIDPHNITKPTIKIGSEFVDLKKEKDLHIKEVI